MHTFTPWTLLNTLINSWRHYRSIRTLEGPLLEGWGFKGVWIVCAWMEMGTEEARLFWLPHALTVDSASRSLCHCPSRACKWAVAVIELGYKRRPRRALRVWDSALIPNELPPSVRTLSQRVRVYSVALRKQLDSERWATSTSKE